MADEEGPWGEYAAVLSSDKYLSDISQTYRRDWGDWCRLDLSLCLVTQLPYGLRIMDFVAEPKQNVEKPAYPGDLSFGQDSVMVLGSLQVAMRALIRLACPIEVRSAADVMRAFGMDRTLCWQIYRIAIATNPLAAGMHVPARVSMKRLLQAAERLNISSSAIHEVSQAFEQFERLVARHADSRSEFDELLAGALPEEREKLHLAARESIHNGARCVRGVTMQTSLMSHVLYPSQDAPGSLDTVNILGHLELRRTRRGAIFECCARQDGRAPRRLKTIDGRPVTETTDIMLPEFCSKPMPTVRAHSDGEQTRFMLEGEDVGTRAAVDSVFASLSVAFRSRYATPERTTTGIAHTMDAPARWQVTDVLVCDGVLPRQDPIVRVYDMVPYGMLTKSPNLNSDIDHVVFDPQVRYMGRGIESFQCSHVPRYVEMLEFICSKRGWDPSRLHGYRVEIEYPVYSWQTMVALQLPPPPSEQPGV